MRDEEGGMGGTHARTPYSSGLIVLYIPVGDVSASAIGSSLRYIVRGLALGSGISRWPLDRCHNSLLARQWVARV